MSRVNMRLFLVVLLVLTTWLGGCSGAGGLAVPQEAGATNSVSSGLIKADYENALPVAMQLALGLFKLDETGSPLTSEQAAALTPLWKAYRSLTTSGEGSSLETEALIVQIQETLSQGQQQAIADMQLTMRDLMQLAQEENLALGGGGGGPGLTSEERATREAQRFSGQSGGQGGEFRPGGGMGPPAGIPPGGGGMMPGGEMPSGAMTTPGARQTAVARQPGGNNNMVSPALVEALIIFLETKAP